MAGHAYQQDDELDRKRDDQTHLAPAEQGGQSKGPDAANQSIAEIGQLYPDGAGGMLDVEHQQCVAPEVDQLALHGAATEPTHVDPIAASVAQAELETQPSAPVAVEAQDSGEAEGPEAGTVQHGKAESPASAQDGLPAAPAAVLTGAATGLTSAVAEGPAAPSKSEAAPAATPGAAPTPDGGQAAKPAVSWEDRARAYNQRHGLIAQFNAATHDACGSGADADPRAVAAWQTAHGVHPDGRIGHLTIDAATKQAPKAEAHDEPVSQISPHAEVAPVAVAKPAPVAETKPAPVAEVKPAPVAPVAEAKPAPVAPAAPAVTAKPTAPAVAAKPVAPVAVAPPAGGDDSFAGTEDIRGKEKDRWAAYGKGDAQTHGWDLGGAHGAKHSGGDVSAAIYATANVEGRYDSVQTYDAGILSFGIMQWTLHAGSLQKFLGFLKDKSGPEGRAAFQEDFVANGIDVAASGGQYQLVYNGKQYPLGDSGAGKAEIDALVRTDPKVARKWSEVFHAAGADPRVQKAQFERAKDMFHEAEGVRFGDKIVDQSLKACKNTFHAKYRSQYGKAQSWMSASPKAAALFFSMRVNNPKYANAAFLKAIDAFYDTQGTDSTKWPATWGDAFGDLVATKSAETLSNWGKEGGGEGRVDKTLRFWDKVHGKPASAPSADAKSSVAQVPKLPPAAAIASKEDSKDAKASKPDPAVEKKLQAQYAGVLHQFVVGQIDQAEAVRKLIAYDQKLHGGHSSIACLILLPAFLADLVKATLARAPKPAPPAPVAEAKPATPTAKPAAPTTKPTVEPRVVAADTAKAPTPVTPVKAPPVPAHVDPAPAQTVAPTSGMTAFVIEAEGQFCQIYVSPGGLTNDSPDVFMFFHGHDAQLGIDPSLQGQKGNASGEDSAGAAMAQAKTKNTIAILPQGVLGKGASHTKEGGFMSALHSGKPGAFATFVDAILAQVGPKLGREHDLVPRHISLAGHSAGGYQGIHDALSSAAKGKYADTISDITLMDSSYSPTHFGDTRDWLFTGSPGKTVRIVQSPDQLKHGYSKDKDKKTVVVEAWHKKYFDAGKLDAYAKAHKMTIKTQSVAGDDRGSNTHAVQHTQIITADGKVQGDVLILESSLDHHSIRDNVIDDSIDSIGQGEAGADTFGKNHIDNYGRKQEPKHDKHDKHAPKAGALVPAPAPADAKHDAAIANPDKAAEITADPGKATGPLKTEAKPSAEDQAAVKPEAGHDEDHTPTPTTDGKEKVSGGKPKAFIKVGREVYQTGGALSHDLLGHGSKTTDLTNKDPKKRHIHLDDAQYKFKQDCYDIATAALGDHIYGGVAKGDLGKTENSLDYRKDCVPHLAALLGAMRSAMAAGTSVKNDKGVEIKAPTNGGITVNSAYRSPEYDRGLWDGYFQQYFIESMEAREKIPEGPLSHKAAQWLVSNIIAWRKAPPGGSNHSNGNAVDLARTVNGKHQKNDYDDQRAWRSSWEYFWLKENAVTYGFTNYKKEAWHWEWWADPAAKR